MSPALPTDISGLAETAAQQFAQRPGLAADYEAERRALLVARLRVTCWLAVVLVPLFGVLDAIIYPRLLGPFLLIRTGMVAVPAAVLPALKSRFAAPLAPALSLLVVCATG